MDYSQAWMGPWGQALQYSPIGGLMSPWAMGSQGAQGVVPQTGLQSLIGQNAEGGETKGFDVGGDPNAAAQTSQATKDRFSQGLTSGIGTAIGKTALGTGAALGMGMPTGMIGQTALGGLTSPGMIGGVLGKSIDSVLGTTPTGFMGKALSSTPGMGLGMALGPMGGLLGGMFGGVVADGVMDAMDTRKREDVRDDYESQGGYFGGRMGYADRVGLEQAAAAVRGAVPNSMAAIHAMDEAIAATRALEQKRGITPSYGMEPGGFSAGKSYGGWASPGGPSVNGARAVDAAYGGNMGGFAGLGIGNPSSYGGRDSSSSGGGPGRGGRGDSTGTGGGYSDGKGGVSGL